MSLTQSNACIQAGNIGSMINDQYLISKKLGGGSFGDIYLGIDQHGGKVAMKFEKVSSRCPQLRHEYKVYRELQNYAGISRVHYFGTHNSHNVMVMDLLGPSLEDLFTKCGRHFSLKTVLQIADQLLDRMETMHNRHLIHRDVKPGNFCIGAEPGSSIIYTIDFGLSTRYRHPQALQHIPYREGRSLTGTPRYASINNHLGYEQSRRDDLESIGYVLIYFLKGSLPWQGLKARNAKRKYKLIMERKQVVSIQQLCSTLPQQFAEYMAYCRSLKFDAKPNMSYLRSLFRELYKRHNYGPNADGSIDWDWDQCSSADSKREDERNDRRVQHHEPAVSAPFGKITGPDGTTSPHATTQHATIGTLGKTSSAVENFNSGDNIQDEIAGRLNAIASLGDSPMIRPEVQVGKDARYACNDKGYNQYSDMHVRSPSIEEPIAASSALKNGRNVSTFASSTGWGMWNLRSRSNGSSFWGTNYTGASNNRGNRSPKNSPQSSPLPPQVNNGIRPNTAPGRRPSKTSSNNTSEVHAGHVVAGTRGMMRYREEQARSTAAAAGIQSSLEGWVSPDTGGRNKASTGGIKGLTRPSTSTGSKPSRGLMEGSGMGSSTGQGNPFGQKDSPNLSSNVDNSMRQRARPMSAKNKGISVSSKKKFMRQPAPFITGKKF